MNPKRSNSGFFVILLILVMAAYYFISVFQPGSGDYSYQQLMRDVKANHVTAITRKYQQVQLQQSWAKITIRVVRLQMSMKRSKILRHPINLLVIRSRSKALITAEI